MFSASRVGRILCGLLAAVFAAYLLWVSISGFGAADAEAARTRRGEAMAIDFKGPHADASAAAAYARAADEAWRERAVLPGIELLGGLIAASASLALLIGRVPWAKGTAPVSS